MNGLLRLMLSILSKIVSHVLILVVCKENELFLFPDYQNYNLRPKQVDLFREFLLQARYPSIFSQMSGESYQITLVEDYPNAFIRDPGEFHSILQ